MSKIVYVDNAATTPVTQKAFEAMLPFYRESYGNPSSVYSIGRESRVAVDDARRKVAAAIGAKPTEIYFTSCGSEADNWAIRGAAHLLSQQGKRHIITTAVEHHAVLHTCQSLEQQGFDITYLPVDSYGMVSPEQVASALRDDTALVSIIYANNEVGSIMPISEIGKLCRERGVLFHTDAVQAVGSVEIDVVTDSVDLLAMSGHKLGAPKGVGALYIRSGVKIGSFIHGGAQERGRRAGTENVASIVAFGTAVEDACTNLEQNRQHKLKLRERTIAELLKLPNTKLNGHPNNRLPGNVNISFEGVEGESLLLMLDMKGICASSGSACTSGSLDPSHVLMAMGLTHEMAHGSLRISYGVQNTEEDVDLILESIPPIIERLRAMSPLWESICKQNI